MTRLSHAWHVAWAVLTSRTVGAVTLIVILLVVLFGTARDHSQDDRARAADMRSKVTACAVSEFATNLTTYFDGRAELIRARLGTRDEQPTDRASLASTAALLAYSQRLASRVGPNCGPVRSTIQPGG